MTDANDSRPVVLEVKNLAKTFGGITALTNFNLTVRKGDIHCLIGPNGAGKTTVLKIITGVYPPTSGRVTLNGRDITGMRSSKVVSNGIAIKMQVPGVYPEMTMYDNMVIAAQNYVPKHELRSEIERLTKLMITIYSAP